MKILLLILIFISFESFAGFVAGSKINQCDRADYISPSLCSEKEGEKCFKVPNDSGECGIFKLVDTYGGPRKSVDDCTSEANCKALLSQKVCLSSQAAFIDENYKFVYCMDKIGKEISIDDQLKTQKDSEKSQATAIANVRAQVKRLRECLAGVVDTLVIRNASKNLTETQVEQMVVKYQPIIDLLYAVSGATAKTKIIAVQPDSLITEADKTALVQEIDKCYSP